MSNPKKKRKSRKRAKRKSTKEPEVPTSQKFIDSVNAAYVADNIDRWKSNKVRNVAKFDIECISAIKARFADKPILIIGNDESFYDNVDVITSLPKDEFVIMCVPENYNKLTELGIVPNFVVCFDQKCYKHAHFVTDDPWGTRAIFPLTARQKDVASWPGNVSWYDPHVEGLDESEDVIGVESCFDSAGAAIYLAWKFGGAPIITIGVDFVHPQPDKSHATIMEITLETGEVKFTDFETWARCNDVANMLIKHKIKIIDAGYNLIGGSEVTRMSIDEIVNVCTDESSTGSVEEPVLEDSEEGEDNGTGR